MVIAHISLLQQLRVKNYFYKNKFRKVGVYKESCSYLKPIFYINLKQLIIRLKIRHLTL